MIGHKWHRSPALGALVRATTQGATTGMGQFDFRNVMRPGQGPGGITINPMLSQRHMAPKSVECEQTVWLKVGDDTIPQVKRQRFSGSKCPTGWSKPGGVEF